LVIRVTIVAMPPTGNRDPDRHRLASWLAPVTIRLAGPDDRAAVARLAELETSAAPPGPHLVAERSGRIEAAISLATGAVLADPFRRTAELRELLRCHAGDARVDPAESRAAARDRQSELAVAVA
jgi:hypothetical protein